MRVHFFVYNLLFVEVLFLRFKSIFRFSIVKDLILRVEDVRLCLCSLSKKGQQSCSDQSSLFRGSSLSLSFVPLSILCLSRVSSVNMGSWSLCVSRYAKTINLFSIILFCVKGYLCCVGVVGDHCPYIYSWSSHVPPSCQGDDVQCHLSLVKCLQINFVPRDASHFYGVCFLILFDATEVLRQISAPRFQSFSVFSGNSKSRKRATTSSTGR